MSKHTPGPWLYTQEGKDAYGIVEQDGTSILHMQALSNSTGARNLEANARLIANAPDLLNALHQVSLCSYNSMSSKSEMGKIARAAIAQATGEDPDHLDTLARERHEANAELARVLEQRIDDGDITTPRDAFFWLLGFAFDDDTGTRIMHMIHAAEDANGGRPC